MDKNLEVLPLWKKFKKDAKGTINYTNVQSLVEKASSLLNQINETFPNYTLHNSDHSLNLVRIMGELLGKSGIKNLTTFETAILILSAYYHDIGMVFSREDKKYIGKEEDDDFNEFLEKHIDAKLIFQRNNNKLNEYLAEWYCRWIHPKRVFYFLKDNKELLKWKEDNKNFSYIEELGFVCKSHGEDIEKLIHNARISINYKSEHDLKFCSLILRCADILDFDNSRTPEEVYNYLGLDNPIDVNEKYSRTQWQAHLCSNGFKVTKNKTLFFDAEPIHPAVEYDVRQFLIVIQNELRNSSQALKKCSKRWQGFDLIYEIEKDIESQGYIYGEHKFALDQNEVLNLLMGENLYADNYVFLREVLQNAIDTSRHREVYEKSENNNDNFKAEAINISEWIDQDGYRWIRVDDFGMGMTKEKIENYFLKIGKSYYESNDFESELLGYKDNKGFKPISRFGIGILSCFIVSDKIEVSTKALHSNPIRLSLEGLNGFFVMQEKDQFNMNEPSIMPNKKGEDELFRLKEGTSIAIRINPSKEKSGFKLQSLLKKYLYYPPIDIQIDGDPNIINGEDKLILNKMIINDKIQIVKLPNELISEIEYRLKTSFLIDPYIQIIPINLTKYSPNKNMCGYLELYHLIYNDKEINKNKSLVKRMMLSRPYDAHELILEYSVELDLWGKRDLEQEYQYLTQEETLSANEQVLLANIKKYLQEYNDFDQLREDPMDTFVRSSSKIDSTLEKVQLSHNGIKINTEITLSPNYTGMHRFNAKIQLKDEFRVNLSVSRDTSKELEWNIVSNLQYTYEKVLREIFNYNAELYCIEIANRYQFIKTSLIVKELKKDPLIDKWLKLKLFLDNKSNYVELSELKIEDKDLNDEVVKINDILHSVRHDFYKIIKSFLLQNYGNMVFKKMKWRSGIFISDKKNSLSNVSLEYYPPLFFIHFEDIDKLRVKDFPLNINHIFSKWLLLNTEKILNKYQSIFYSIRENISIYNYKVESKDIIEPVNQLIERLYSLDNTLFEQYKKSEVLLKKDDFEL